MTEQYGAGRVERRDRKGREMSMKNVPPEEIGAGVDALGRGRPPPPSNISLLYITQHP